MENGKAFQAKMFSWSLFALIHLYGGLLHEKVKLISLKIINVYR